MFDAPHVLANDTQRSIVQRFSITTFLSYEIQSELSIYFDSRPGRVGVGQGREREMERWREGEREMDGWMDR